MPRASRRPMSHDPCLANKIYFLNTVPPRVSLCSLSLTPNNRWLSSPQLAQVSSTVVRRASSAPSPMPRMRPWMEQGRPREPPVKRDACQLSCSICDGMAWLLRAVSLSAESCHGHASVSISMHT